MDIKELIERNYSATVKRGKIKPETSEIEFAEKLIEEANELKIECDFANENLELMTIEMADCALVLFAMAKHFDIDLIQAMEEKVKFNEQRTD